MARNSILIAALASKPQLITLALDCLALQNETPGEVLVVHTDRRQMPTCASLEQLETVMRGDFPSVSFRNIELHTGQVPLHDVTSPDEVQAAFQALFAEVRTQKLHDKSIHLLISGGRRTLTVFGMAVAQMLFDDRDALWHLASHPELETSGRLHAGPGEWARLIPIPVIPWGRLSPVFDVLRSVDDPFQASERLHQMRLREQWDLARIFVLTKLSPAELAVVELLSHDGLSQTEAAEKLALSPRTVEQHLRAAYRKAAEHWEVESVNQTQLVRLLSLYFSYKP